MGNNAMRDSDEFVLDSIRRLLSDNAGVDRGMPAGRPRGEKLLLTPALRVAPVPAAQVPPHWSLEDRIAELETDLGDAPMAWDVDGPEESWEDRPLTLRPHPANAAAVEAEDDDPADGTLEAGFDIDADERLPDEDALRDLVAEIVRQELQSDLGARVTRNIRKLVRREIRRALAARDFDNAGPG